MGAGLQTPLTRTDGQVDCDGSAAEGADSLCGRCCLASPLLACNALWCLTCSVACFPCTICVPSIGNSVNEEQNLCGLRGGFVLSSCPIDDNDTGCMMGWGWMCCPIALALCMQQVRCCNYDESSIARAIHASGNVGPPCCVPHCCSDACWTEHTCTGVELGLVTDAGTTIV